MELWKGWGSYGCIHKLIINCWYALIEADEQFIKRWGRSHFEERYVANGIDSIWNFTGKILPCRVYLRHCILAVSKQGQVKFYRTLLLWNWTSSLLFPWYLSTERSPCMCADTMNDGFLNWKNISSHPVNFGRFLGQHVPLRPENYYSKVFGRESRNYEGETSPKPC